MVKLDLSNAQHIAIALDCSGGTLDEQKERALDWIDYQLADHPIRLDFWCFDTRVMMEYSATYAPGKIYRVQKHLPIGGGTDIEVNWAHMLIRGIRPDLLVIITDGFFNPPLMSGIAKVPVVWAIFKDDFRPNHDEFLKGKIVEV